MSHINCLLPPDSIDMLADSPAKSKDYFCIFFAFVYTHMAYFHMAVTFSSDTDEHAAPPGKTAAGQLIRISPKKQRKKMMHTFISKYTALLAAAVLLSGLTAGCTGARSSASSSAAVSAPSVQDETLSDYDDGVPVPKDYGEDQWDGSISEGFSGGDGSVMNPWQINSAADLAYLAYATNSGKENGFKDQYFILQADIDLNTLKWIPIGRTEETPFAGTLDGCGHTVRNLMINSLPEQCSAAGLFGCVTGRINTVSVSGEIALSGGNLSAGSLCGILSGQDACLSVVHSDASINITDMDSGCIGGLAGQALDGAVITDSLFSGYLGTDIREAGADSSVSCGGICGTLSNSMVDASVCEAQIESGALHTGGIAGIASSSASGEMEAVVSSCRSASDISLISERDESTAAGLIGSVDPLSSRSVRLLFCLSSCRIESSGAAVVTALITAEGADPELIIAEECFYPEEASLLDLYGEAYTQAELSDLAVRLEENSPNWTVGPDGTPVLYWE